MIGHCHCQHNDFGTTNESFNLKTEGQIKRKSFIYFVSGTLISGKQLGPTSKWVGPLLITCEESCGKLKTQVELLSFLFLPKTKQNEKKIIFYFFQGQNDKKGYFVKKNCLFVLLDLKNCKLTFSHNCVWLSFFV
jgi:hypothetical protein